MSLPARILCLAAAALSAGANAATRRTDVVTLGGHAAGEQAVSLDATGTSRATYHYKDRGRGENIRVTWKLDANGILVDYRATGNDYLNVPVDETYTLRARKAVWKSHGEQGEKTLQTPAFYMPAAAAPELLGVLARALLRAPDRRLPLLPDGEAQLQEVGRLRIGDTRELTLYHIHGLDFVAKPIWLDADGATAAQVSSWQGVYDATLAASLDALMLRQAEIAAAASARLARELTHVPAGPLLIRNARVFDPVDLSVTPGTSVLVVGARIVRVAPDRALDAPPDAEVFDAGNRFLMPGLWDVHKHYADSDGLLDIATGITSTRDLANDTVEFPARVKRFDAGSEIGPRVLMAGFIDGVGANPAPLPVRVDSAAEALRWVDWYADNGYVQIKVYSSLKPELVPLIADRAHARGLRLSGHVPAAMSARTFIEAGADEIQHFNFMVLDLLYPGISKTQDMTRFTAVAEHAHEFTPDSPEVKTLIAALKRHRTVLDPTINFFEDLYSGDTAAKVPQALADVVARLPPQVRRNLSWGALDVPKGQEANYRAAFPALLRLLEAFHDAGIVLLPGSDALAGYSLQYELMLYARAGIPPAEVLRLATLTPSQVLGVAHERGVIAAGKLADMVLLDGDPLADMSDIRKVVRVYKGGRWYDPAALERALGITPRADP